MLTSDSSITRPDVKPWRGVLPAVLLAVACSGQHARPGTPTQPQLSWSAAEAERPTPPADEQPSGHDAGAVATERVRCRSDMKWEVSRHGRFCRSGRLDPEARCDRDLQRGFPLGQTAGEVLSLRQARGNLVLVTNRPIAFAGSPLPRTKPAFVVTGIEPWGKPQWQCLGLDIRGQALDDPGSGHRPRRDASAALDQWLRSGDILPAGPGLFPEAHALDVLASHLESRVSSLSRHLLRLTTQKDVVITSVDLASSGNAAVAGHFLSEIDFGKGVMKAPTYESLFVVMYRGDGELGWAKVSAFAEPVRGPRSMPAVQVRFSADGGLVVAGQYRQQPVFGVRLPPATPLVLNDCGYSPIMELPAHRRPRRKPGEKIIHRLSRVFLARWSPEGNLLSARGYGSKDAGIGTLDVTPEGDLLVAGRFRGALSYGGAEVHAPRGNPRCRCRIHCLVPESSYVARLDGRAEPHWLAASAASVVRAWPGHGNSTVLAELTTPLWEQAPRQEGPTAALASNLELRDASGKVIWSRSYPSHRVVGVAAHSSRSLGVLLRHDFSNSLHYLSYTPEPWRRRDRE